MTRKLLILVTMIALKALTCKAQDASSIVNSYILERFDATSTYYSAKTACEGRNSRLVEIKTQEMQDAAADLIKSRANHRCWLGLTWNEGINLTFSNWNTGEPNNPSTENCIEILTSGVWNNLACNSNNLGYICQTDIKLSLSPVDQDIVVVTGEGNTTISINVNTYDGPAVIVRAYKEPDTTNPIQEFSDVTSRIVTFDLGPINETHAGNYKIDASINFNLYTRRATATISVHVPAAITNLSPTEIRAPVTTGPDHVTCTAYGIPTPTVKWFKDGVAVTTSNTSNVCQTIQTTIAKLWVEKAEKSDVGTYTCRAKNTVGEDSVNIQAEQNIWLAVFGPPIINQVSTENCSSNDQIHVNWTSDKDTKVKHRFTIIPINETDQSTQIRDVIPSVAGKSEITKFKKLEIFTSYNVSITVCPDDCIQVLNISAHITTGIRQPGPVRNVTLKQSDDTNVCLLSWTWPNEKFSYQIIDFQVNFTSKFYYQPSGIPSVSNNTLNYTSMLSLQTALAPNLNFTFSIRARTCAGYGPTTVSKGLCITKQQGPDFIPLSSLSNGIIVTQREIKIQLPSEFYGPISCIFVVLHPTSQSSASLSLNTMEELEKFLKAASSNDEPETNKYYIAIAIPRSNITPTNNKFVLGDGSETSCRVNTISKRRKKRAATNKEYRGKNFPLQNFIYSFVIVFTTPVYDESVIYTASEEQTFDNTSPTGPSYGWIAAVIIVIIIISGVSAFILYKKRRGKLITEHSGQSLSMDIVEAEQNYENLDIRRVEKESDTLIRMEHLQKVYKKLKANKNTELEDQFAKIVKIAKETTSPTAVASKQASKKKNRYKNILPFDETRVILGNENGEDYINANFINGYEQPHKFIATQGPLPQTVQDFWWMVVDQKCKVIVMLTKCMEKAKKKCEKYWPNKGDTENHGEFTVTNQEERYFGGFLRRMMKVKSVYKEELIVHQYQYMKWPDHGVPITTSSFFKMYKEVMKSQNIGSTRPPIIVHCSAGCGRTGTFIGYDILLEESQSQNCIDVFACVSKMRTQRNEMVQTCDQYTFIHKLLLESHLYGDTDLEASELKKLHEENPGDFNERMEKEFKNLTLMDASKNILDDANEKFSQFNRDQNIVPFEHSRVIITKQQHDREEVYLNASNIQTYNNLIKIIAAQGPMDTTTEIFWRAVIDNNVTTIIMLTKLKDQEQEQCTHYWPSQDEEVINLNGITVILKEEYASEGIVDRKLEVKRGNDIKNIKQHQYNYWSSTTCPDNPKALLDIISKMNLSIAAEKEQAAVLVHCSNGAGRTGAFCAIANLIERVKAENRVDVFRAVKDLRDYRPGMVQTLDQYRFCYDAVLSYLTNCNLYANYASVKKPNPIYENFTA